MELKFALLVLLTLLYKIVLAVLVQMDNMPMKEQLNAVTALLVVLIVLEPIQQPTQLQTQVAQLVYLTMDIQIILAQHAQLDNFLKEESQYVLVAQPTVVHAQITMELTQLQILLVLHALMALALPMELVFNAK